MLGTGIGLRLETMAKFPENFSVRERVRRFAPHFGVPGVPPWGTRIPTGTVGIRSVLGTMYRVYDPICTEHDVFSTSLPRYIKYIVRGT